MKRSTKTIQWSTSDFFLPLIKNSSNSDSSNSDGSNSDSSDCDGNNSDSSKKDSSNSEGGNGDSNSDGSNSDSSNSDSSNSDNNNSDSSKSDGNDGSDCIKSDSTQLYRWHIWHSCYSASVTHKKPQYTCSAWSDRCGHEYGRGIC